MTAEQFSHWEEFSLAMALRGWEGMTRARRQRLHDAVATFFDEVQSYSPEDEPHPYLNMVDWDDSNHGEMCVGDWVTESFDDYRKPEKFYKGVPKEDDGRFYDACLCCVRAGIDIASSPSAGVLGFSVGDLQRMFFGVIPVWVHEFFAWTLIDANDSDGVWL